MENKKYEFTGETMLFNTHLLHRIVALKNLPFISKGEKGGWIESEDNLSQEGNCWVYNEAKVTGCAKISGDARIMGNAVVNGYAEIFDYAVVRDNVNITGHVKIHENALVKNNATIYGAANIYGMCRIGYNAVICGNAEVYGDAMVHDYANIYKNAVICGDAIIADSMIVGGSTVIKSNSDFLYVRNNFSSLRPIMWTKSDNMWRTGCFFGNAEELIAKAEQDDVFYKAHHIGKVCNKADYFRTLVGMVEKFNELSRANEEFIKENGVN